MKKILSAEDRAAAGETRAEVERKKVVYILGAGATQGCLKFANSTVGLLMKDLSAPMLEDLSAVVAGSDEYKSAIGLVSSVFNEKTDFEHVLTFLDQSPNAVHRSLARKAREIFLTQLSKKITAAVESNGGEVPNYLYRALLDLHEIAEFPEELSGLITLNYDMFLEHAIIDAHRYRIDWGVSLAAPKPDPQTGRWLPYLKLHGSFGWVDAFPLSSRELNDKATVPLWIPPGILKEKQRYPFNLIWGRVREVLDCDVVRIVGWRLGPNDWDLISLLFSTRHGNANRPPYVIEYIGSPKEAERLKKEFPYLGVRSILETDRVGEILTAEYLARPPPFRFDSLSEKEQGELADVLHEKGRNWFLDWLKQNIEWLHINRREITPDLKLPGVYRVFEAIR